MSSINKRGVIILQFGYTIPLQKHLKMKAPPCSDSPDFRFCWEVHVLTIFRRKAIIAVNANSRYAVMLYGVKGANRKNLPEVLQREIKAAFVQEGISEFEIARYFQLAGPLEITKTHGPKAVATLNRAVDALCLVSPPLDESSLYQPLASSVMNDDYCHAPGYKDFCTPREFLLRDFQTL